MLERACVATATAVVTETIRWPREASCSRRATSTATRHRQAAAQAATPATASYEQPRVERRRTKPTERATRNGAHVRCSAAIEVPTVPTVRGAEAANPADFHVQSCAGLDPAQVARPSPTSTGATATPPAPPGAAPSFGSGGLPPAPTAVMSRIETPSGTVNICCCPLKVYEHVTVLDRWRQLDGSAALAPDCHDVSAPATAGTHQTANSSSNRTDVARQLDPRLDPHRLTSPPAVTTSIKRTTSSPGGTSHNGRCRSSDRCQSRGDAASRASRIEAGLAAVEEVQERLQCPKTRLETKVLAEEW